MVCTLVIFWYSLSQFIIIIFKKIFIITNGNQPYTYPVACVRAFSEHRSHPGLSHTSRIHQHRTIEHTKNSFANNIIIFCNQHFLAAGATVATDITRAIFAIDPKRIKWTQRTNISRNFSGKIIMI